MMNRRLSFVSLLPVLFLAGCGTLQIDIEYNSPTAVAVSGSATETRTAAPATATATRQPAPRPTDTGTTVPSDTIPAVISAEGISSGANHTCVVTNAGGVNCWGNNEHGQLGDGTMVNSSVPVAVKDLRGVAALAAGWSHTCALTDAGAVWCWGYNQNGELGNGKTADSSLPVPVSGLTSGVASIGTREDHTCAVLMGGAVRCWGYNEFGQLGDGTRTSRSVPVDVQGLTGRSIQVVAGMNHTCVLAEGGGAQCWGDNQSGQLGYGQEAKLRLTPVDVLGLLSGVIALTAANDQTCALTTGGAASCWGNNKYGQLGDGTSDTRYGPVPIEGLEQGTARIAMGWNHACAVLGRGEVKCWGWNYYGQLGDETRATQTRPVSVRRLMEDALDVAIGWAHTCAVTTAGGVKCWGRNDFGQLGDGTTIDSIVPLSISGLRIE